MFLTSSGVTDHITPVDRRANPVQTVLVGTARVCARWAFEHITKPTVLTSTFDILPDPDHLRDHRATAQRRESYKEQVENSVNGGTRLLHSVHRIDCLVKLKYSRLTDSFKDIRSPFSSAG